MTRLYGRSRKVLEVPDAIYKIVGEGPEKEALFKLTAALGLERNIIFKQGVEEKELTLHYRDCDIFILVSRQLNEVKKWKDSGSCSWKLRLRVNPQLARKAEASGSVIDGYTGLLVEPDNIEAIADAIIRAALRHDTSRKISC